MLLQRTAIAVARRAAMTPVIRRSLATTTVRRSAAGTSDPTSKPLTAGMTKTLSEIKTEDDLLSPGAAPGTVPTDLENATGLERLELLGKMEGVDVFSMEPLDSSRLGTMDNPIPVRSAGLEQYAACSGSPIDSHTIIWLTVTRDRPIERCPECGSVYKMAYVGHPDAVEDHIEWEEPKTWVDYVRPEYHH